MAEAAMRETALREAEAACLRRGATLTPLRRQVLELVLEADAPVGAYALLDRLKASRPGAAPPTVYRALEFLERLGFAHRIESLNAYVPCRHDGGEHRAAFLICDCCGAAQEFEPDFSAQLKAAESAGYQVATITLEARGRCSACRAG